MWRGRQVAVKLFHEIEDVSTSFSELRHESFLMSQLKHENIVELLGITLQPFALLMDFYSLGSLDKYVKKDCLKFTHKFRLALALDVAKGMSYLHSQDVIHRDLRSPNILLVDLNENAEIIAKVTDFGTAVKLASAMSGGDLNECWTAPEVLEGKKYDEKVDVYSMGIVLWETLQLGGHPFSEFGYAFRDKPRIDLIDAISQGLRPIIPPETPTNFANLIRL